MQQRFITFVNERYNILAERNTGKPPPWTKDKILQKYRFCNVRREDDAVTKWLAANWRKPNFKDPYLWFAMVLARHINDPETLEEVGYPIPWKPARFKKIIAERKSSGARIFNPAYIIVPANTKMDKIDYIADILLAPMWQNRDQLIPQKRETLANYAVRLGEYRGMGTFMTAQVIADLKYAAPLVSAKDWWTWAASGPGSKRGMNRLLKRDAHASMPERQWHEELLKLQAATKGKIPELHAQDLQNCLCEFDKYERVRKGEGVPKQRYNGGE